MFLKASALLVLVTMSTLLASPQQAHTHQRDLLYGTWRWLDSAGDSMPALRTPEICGCERLLILNRGGTYEFVEWDSTREYLLCEGKLSVRQFADVMIEDGPADFWISLEGWWIRDERTQFVRFTGTGTDTLLTFADGSARSRNRSPRHRFVRAESSPERLKALHAKRRAARDRPLEPAPLPAEDGMPYDDPPVPTRNPAPVYPQFARDAQIQGEVRLYVLVGADGLVRNIKVIRGVTGLNDSAIDAVKKWVFEPARRDGQPVAAWIEIPLQFHF